jgi:Ni,Fe-hydrogenase III large subunit
MTLTHINVELLHKWRKLPEDVKKKTARQVGVSVERINGFFMDKNDMTYKKVVELEKHLS